MRILADENFAKAVVARLRDEGHDVAWVRDSARGSSDASVLARAQREGRIVATFDKGFGELAFRARLPASSGILLFRIRGASSASVAARVSEALDSREDWTGLFATITDEGIRVRHLPSGGRKVPGKE